MSNPLLAPWTGPHGMPPFAEVRAEQFAPAFEVAMRDHLAEIDALAAVQQAPTFANTVAAFDRAGRLLERVSSLFHNLTSSETSPALQAVERDMQPLAKRRCVRRLVAIEELEHLGVPVGALRLGRRRPDADAGSTRRSVEAPGELLGVAQVLDALGHAC